MKRVFVFPCGSEIGLEIHRSVRYSSHFHLIGGSSVHDHGAFTYENYIGGIPFYDDPAFIPIIQQIVLENNIDAIFPTMDSVAKALKDYQADIGCVVIGSSPETTSICASKSKTYSALDGVVSLPKVYSSLAQIKKFPVFIKPDVGYGARNVVLAKTKETAKAFLNKNQSQKMLLCEYLPGEEYTVDCFSDYHGKLRFAGPRLRSRVSNGISVNTIKIEDHRNEFSRFAEAINSHLLFQGAWFFQVKRNVLGQLTLLEVAARLGGSSSLYRNLGVNFALLSLFDAFLYDVEIIVNDYCIELDRSLSCKFKIPLLYKTIYVDYDDCLMINNRINVLLVAFLYSQLHLNKKLILLTRHAGDIHKALKVNRLYSLFDQIIHLRDKEKKSDYITEKSAIFIDDSHKERLDVKQKCGISVFSPDMVESLLK
ncbi:MAG: ATP-grasp domain-containing protein [Sulfurospirillum cavolei]|nr:ATP-grasp domain-containing protein [Sulfurospirillum cavolei]